MRLADPGTWTLLACALVLAVPAPARAQSQEEKRRQLQERLGIKPPPTQAAPDAGVPGPGAPPPAEAARTPAAPPARTPAGANRPRVPGFEEDIRPLLEKECKSCHGPEGMAARSRWVLRGEPADYEATLRFVQPATAAQSPLLKKGAGTTFHGGKKVLAVESAGYGTLLRWIEGGAPPGKARGGAPAAVASASPGVPRPTHDSAPASAHPSGSPAPITSTTPAATPAPGASTPTVSNLAPSASASAAPPSEDASAAPRFAPRVHEALLADCSSCHASDGMAGAGRYVTHADPEQHLRSVAPLVVPGSAATSILFQRARGDAHPGGAVWSPGSAQLALLGQWIDAG
ncbi:hypothetical protein D7V80_30230, partial [Corallococcus sp. CA054B]